MNFGAFSMLLNAFTEKFLKFKECHQVHDDLKLSEKNLTPGRQPKKWRQCFIIQSDTTNYAHFH